MSRLARDARWAVLTAVVVFLAAKASYDLALEGIVNVWFPSGVMLGLLLVSERTSWASILVGGLLGNAVADVSQDLGLLLVAGGPLANGLEALCAALVVQALAGRENPVTSLRGVGSLLFGAAVLSNAVTALPGAWVLSSFYGAPLGSQWLIWWIGDGLGMLVAAPTILGMDHLARRTPRERRARMGLEAAGFAAVALGLAVFGFNRPGALNPLMSVLILPPLILAGLRMREGAHGLVLLASIVVLWYSAQGRGPLVEPGLTPFEVAVQVLAFLGLVTGMVLVIAAVVLEREAAGEQRERLRDEFTHALEARVWTRTRELQEANAELQAFTYSVSHDLKAPLRAIDGYSAFLQDALEAGRFDEALSLVKEIRTGSRGMARLIDDLLLFARVGRAEVTRRRVELAPLVTQIMERERSLAPERDIRLEATDLPAVEGDEALVRQALENVLGNAVKFTLPREIAVVRVTARQEGEWVEITVRDNGVGFPPELAGNLFRVFHRLHHSDDFEGTGVGLAIVRRIVERHGGTVAAESVPDTETAVRFTLPASPEPLRTGSAAVA